jgi:hypothetical protein
LKRVERQNAAAIKILEERIRVLEEASERDSTLTSSLLDWVSKKKESEKNSNSSSSSLDQISRKKESGGVGEQSTERSQESIPGRSRIGVQQS